MVDEVESELSGKRHGRRPKSRGRCRLANIASRKEIIGMPFNFPNTVQVWQACLTAVTVAAVAYPYSHLVPGTRLAYLYVFELGRADYVFVVRSLGHFRNASRGRVIS
jgi:hypothetical protein